MLSNGDERPTPGRDLVGYLIRYPQQIAFGDEDPAAVMDSYHTTEFEMVTDGIRLNRERLLAHVRAARKRAAGVHVVVHDTVSNGDRVAARYTMTATMRKGPVITTEIYMFGELAPDGRLHHVDQVTRTIPAAEG